MSFRNFQLNGWQPPKYHTISPWMDCRLEVSMHAEATATDQVFLVLLCFYANAEMAPMFLLRVPQPPPPPRVKSIKIKPQYCQSH